MINAFLLLPFIMVLFTVRVASIDTFYGVSVIGNAWFFYCVALTLGSIIAIYVFNRKRVIISITDILLLLFCASGVSLSVLYSEILSTKVFALILSLILYFNFRILFSQSTASRFILILFFVINGLFEAILGLQQLYGYTDSNHELYSVTGSFQNPGPYAGYLAMIFPLAGYYTFRDWRLFFLSFNKRYIPFYIRLLASFSALLTIMVILPATMSRASWIAVFLSMGVVGIIICFYQKNWLELKKHFFSLKRIVTLIFLIVAIFVFIIPKAYYMKKDSADGRLLLWKISSKTILSNLGGVGVGHFAGAYGIQQAKYFESGKGSEQEQHVADSPKYAFNDYLQIAVEFGLFPFFMFCIVLSCGFYSGLRSKNNIGLIGAYSAVLIFACMSYPFNLLPFIIAFVFLLALLNDSKAQKIKPFSISNRSKNKKIYLVIANFQAIILLMTISCFIVGYIFYKQRYVLNVYQEVQRAKWLFDAGHYREAVKSYSKVVPYVDDNVEILFDFGQVLNKEKKYDQSNGILHNASKLSSDPMIYNTLGKNYQELQNYDLAEHYYEKSSNMVPNRIYPYFLMANLYMHLEELSKAKKAARIVLEKKPKVDSYAIREMKSKMTEILEIN